MRLLLLLLTFLGASTAHAEARLRLLADRPVVIIVNMVPHTVGDSAATSVTLRDGKEGNQRVMVRNLLGQELWHGNLVVKRGTITTAKWMNRELVIVSEKPMKTSRRYNVRGGVHSADAGSRQLNDLADDGDQIDADAHLLDIVAADDPQRPPADYDGTPEPVDPPVDGQTTPAPAPAATADDFDGEVKALVPPGSGAMITLISRESSWSNVWLDGELVWEFRGKTSGMRLHIPPGTHELAFKDFQNRNTWASGTVQAAQDAPVEIRFGMSTGAEAFETPSAWAPNN